ncbi:hypothetical protein [Candidatus Nitrosotenuis cloacae]|uniref:hypothetical protein n=1 Tax=Candidatus Nitrosotenuis cloacae TaxID=1603555 RepID=UPI0022812D80|nr:hypothetical protein [Candidatus Nitrosotenuis cloacae]
MIERGFDFTKLYGRIVRYYLDKRRYSKERANEIAQKVVQRERRIRTCQKCAHLTYDHLRNYESCLVGECDCQKFERPLA